MTTTTLHIDHRKVTVSITDSFYGKKIIRPIRDAGASTMWDEKKNPVGQYLRKQWSKTATRKDAGYAVILEDSIMEIIAE